MPLHAQKATPTTSCSNALPDTVKGNQPSLQEQLKTLPWKDLPPARTAQGHLAVRRQGRDVATEIVFPHARQAMQIARKTRKLQGTKWTTEVEPRPQRPTNSWGDQHRPSHQTSRPEPRPARHIPADQLKPHFAGPCPGGAALTR
jgi:hypothetical protein